VAVKRRWRIYITAGFATDYTTIAEIELRAVVGGADITGSGTAYASSFFSGQPASNAFDNSTGSSWTTADAVKPCWIAYDFGLGNEVEIKQFTMQALASWQGRMPKDFELQSSGEDGIWTTVAAFANEPAWSSGEIRVYTPLTGPAAPTNLTATKVSATALNLNWTDVATDEDGYRVYQDNVLIATLPANSTSYAVTGLSAQVYTFRVASFYTAGGEGSTSIQAAPFTPPRVSTAGAYVVDATPIRRLSTAGVYVVHGPNERRLSTAGVYVVELDLPPVPGPNKPVISLTSKTTEQVNLRSSVFSHPLLGGG
jgi:hypothetical protein